MLTIHKNIIANYIGKLWGFISVYIFIPLYVKILGVESYGVIGFYTVLLSIMLIADAGLSAAFSREAARTDDKTYLGNLLRTFEWLYIGICFCAAFFVILGSPFIASNWLRSGAMPPAQLAHCISLMGICVALQLFITLYTGGLNGLQKQVLLNVIQTGHNMCRAGLVVIPLYFIPSIYTFFLWQITVNIIFLLLLRYQIWRFIKNGNAVFSLALLRGIWKFALGMMSMAVISALNTQIDKLITSKFLSLADFGIYSLAGTLANVPVILTMPVAIAVLPQLTRYSEEKKAAELKRTYFIYTFIITVAAGTVTAVLFAYTKDWAYIWLADNDIAERIAIITKILIAGGMFLSLQLMPFYLSLANGHNTTNIKLGVIGLLLIVPLLIVLISKYGLIGASIPWFCLNFTIFLILGYLLTSKFLRGTFKKWIINNIALPLLVIVIITSVVYFFTYKLPKGYFVLLYGIVIAAATLAANAVIMQRLYPNLSIKKAFTLFGKRK